MHEAFPKVVAGYWRGLMVCAAWVLTSCGGDGASGSQTYTIGGVVSGLSGGGLVLRNNGGDDLSIAGNGRFAFATALAAGSAYSVTVGSQPTDSTLNCLVMNAGRSGVVESANVTTVSVRCAPVAKIAYVGYVDSASAAPATVALDIDPRSGELTQGPTQLGSAPPYAMAARGRYAYRPDASGGIAGFSVDSASGSLAPLAGSPFGVGAVPTNPGCTLPGSCVDPAPAVTVVVADTEYLYAYYVQMGPCCPTIPVVSSIVAFSVNAGTGALGAVAVPVAGGNPTAGMQIDPGERFLYSANQPNIHLFDPGGTARFVIDQASGALTFYALDSSVTLPLAFEPQGNYAYAVDAPSASAEALAIDPTNGAFTPIGSNVMAAGLSAIAADPAGAFAYGGCAGGICGFSLDPTQGALTALAGSPFPTGVRPSALIIDPSGRFALGICAAAVCVYTLDPVTGTPRLAPGSPFAIKGVIPASIFVAN